MVSRSFFRHRILILIPAYNEAGAIHQVVKNVQTAVPYADVLVIDDGSGDNTVEVAQTAGAQVLRHPFNLCIGGTFQTGLKFASQQHYDFVVRVDGDGQHDPNDIEPTLEMLRTNEADVIVCSRFLKGTPTMRIPWLRMMGIRHFAWLVTRLTGSRATDTTSGFIGMNGRAIELLSRYMPQDYPEVESRITLNKAGLRTLERPTLMVNRASGVSSINSWRSVYYAIKVSIAVLISAFKETHIAPG